MPEQQLENNQKKGVANTEDLLDTFGRQIRNLAYELQFGNIVVDYKVRNGEIKEAHRVAERLKLRPF